MDKGISLLVFLLFRFAVTAQPINNEILVEKFHLYHKIHSSTNLFLHIDKSVYTNNEKIWFGAYLINKSESSNVHGILNVFLVQADRKKVVLDGKFMLENGLSSGNLQLPDTIAPGSYRLESYTNAIDKKGFPIASFSVPIEIKSITQQDFNSDIKLLDSTINQGMVCARITVKANNPEAMKKFSPLVKYSIGKGDVHTAVLKNNEAIITIPKEQLAQNKPTLLTTISYGKQVQHLSISLPGSDQKQVEVRFFPEGGNLCYGLPGVVGWEAKTNKGIPMGVTGLLLKDNIVVDTIESNSYGMGSFRIVPDSKSTYTLKINAGDYFKLDTVFILPRVTAGKVSLNLPEAIVKDSLRLNLYSQKRNSVQVLIHNYEKAYMLFKTPVLLAENHFRLPLDALPKGLTTVTVLDEEGKHLAERIFFAHYDESIIASIQTEKNYAKNDSVKVKIKITDHLGNPVQGVFSAAVVEDNRIGGNFRDIETSVYLNQNIGMLPQDPLGMSFKNKEYLENMLLIKGWRRYSWEGLMSSKATDTLVNFTIPEMKGSVKLRGNPLQAPVEVIALNSDGVSIINSNNDGYFNLNPDQLKATGSKIKLAVNGGDKNKYKIEVDDPYQKINTRLAGRTDNTYNSGIINNKSSVDQALKGLERTISLRTVDIKASKSNGTINGFKGEPGANACGDYVDEFDYLNYEKSEHKFKPVNGKTYLKRTDLQGNYFKVESVYYTGCTVEQKSHGFTINGIADGKEYYESSSEIPDNQYRSTLYWQSGIATNAAGEAELMFKTGELGGRFRIAVQGVTTSNLISGYGSFIVK